MFLRSLQERNHEFLNAAAALHRAGEIPANSFVLDLDAVARNARRIADEASRHGLQVLAMTKQVGRNPDFADVLRANGIGTCVAVDMECARANSAAGFEIGNIGHLVQVPRSETTYAGSLDPANWTVFNLEKAEEAGQAARLRDRIQNLLLRVYAEGDTFYPGHEGGFSLVDLDAAFEPLARIPNVQVVGVTTFPALLFDPTTRAARLTPNVRTTQLAAQKLRAAGYGDVRVNLPGTTSTSVLAMLAEAGATHVEPGHGLTGTTPLHAYADLPEEPACLYLSEVSHHYGGQAYFLGGGLYIDPVFPRYDVKALVFPSGGDEPLLLRADLPSADLIDYYGKLEGAGAATVPVGSSVILGFRFQAFVTRAHVVGITSVAERPRPGRLCTAAGVSAAWPPVGALS
jgi:predicted amino acid racemase